MDLNLFELIDRPQNFEIIFSDGEFYVFEKEAKESARTPSGEAKNVAAAPAP